MSRARLIEANWPRSAKSLESSLRTLTPGDNMPGFYWEGELTAGQEIRVRNQNRDGTIPSHYLVCYQDPLPALAKGLVEWTQEYVTIRNTAATTTITAKVFFYYDRGINE